jgi:hypothetical protein
LGAVAEELERWTERTPEWQSLFDRTPAIELSREVARLQHELATAADPPALPPKREWGPFMTSLLMPWSYGDRAPGDFWHHMLCRVGRHEIAGGHSMQLAGTVVFVERQCRWCGLEPG